MNKIGLFSAPRSGSTWLGEIINSAPQVLYKFQPNFSYSFNMELTESSSANEIELFFRELEECDNDFVNGRLSISSQRKTYEFYKGDLNTLCFKETHFLNVIENLLTHSDIKIIGLIRSPFAVLNSWLAIPKEFDPSWSVEEEWQDAKLKNANRKSHYFGYNKWKEACNLFLRLEELFSERFLIINYDDILINPEKQITELFDFCGIKYSKQTKAFLLRSTQSQNDDAYSVFRKKVNDLGWRDCLPDFITEAIKHDDEFKRLNIRFKWI